MVLARLAPLQRRLDSFEANPGASDIFQPEVPQKPTAPPERPPESRSAEPFGAPPPAEPTPKETEAQTYVAEKASAVKAALSATAAPDRGASQDPPVLPPASTASVSSGEPPKSGRSLEQTLGTKWIAWVGIGMVLIGMAFFLKYAYDQGWFGGIGPTGRLALGCLAGLAALGAAFMFYVRKRVSLEGVRARNSGFLKIVENQYSFDEVYQWTIDRVVLVFSRFIAYFDRAIVNDIIVNGPADMTRKFGILIRLHVTGHVYTYTLAMALGSVGLGLFVWLRGV